MFPQLSFEQQVSHSKSMTFYERHKLSLFDSTEWSELGE